MDQIFDRLGNLLKSVFNDDDEAPASRPASSRGGTTDFDDAMAELDAFLNDDRERQEQLKREQENRRRAEEAARTGTKQTGRPSAYPPKLAAAYQTFGLPVGAPLAEVKAAYKRLLKEHHPDRHGGSPDALRKATETSARINNAFRLIETWSETGTLGDE